MPMEYLYVFYINSHVIYEYIYKNQENIAMSFDSVKYNIIIGNVHIINIFVSHHVTRIMWHAKRKFINFISTLRTVGTSFSWKFCHETIFKHIRQGRVYTRTNWPHMKLLSCNAVKSEVFFQHKIFHRNDRKVLVFFFIAAVKIILFGIIKPATSQSLHDAASIGPCRII